MKIIYIDKRPILTMTIENIKVTVKFADKANPEVMDNILEILTSRYEQRIQALINNVIRTENAQSVC